MHTTRRICLIGGAGYIGSYLTGYLLNLGYSVTCLDLLIYQNGFAVSSFLSNPRYAFIQGDLADSNLLQQALAGCTDVVILAGLVGNPICNKFPKEAEQINVKSIQQLIYDLKGRGLSKVVFISTCSNYGYVEEGRMADESSPLNPLSTYAKAKVLIEEQLLSKLNQLDYTPVVLRFATAFGLSPRMRFDLTANEFVATLYNNQELSIYDADTWRPYCHVADFSEIIRRILESPKALVEFQVFNAGSEKNHFTKRMLVDAARSRFPKAVIKYQTGTVDKRNYRVNFSRLREVLDFEPTISLEDGISEILEAFKQGSIPTPTPRNRFGNYEI